MSEGSPASPGEPPPAKSTHHHSISASKRGALLWFTRRRPWWQWSIAGVGSLLALLLVANLLFSHFATPYIRDKLQGMIAQQLNAELRMQSLTYDYPYGVKIENAVLVAKDEQGQPIELLNVPKLELELAKLPFGSGPLVFRKLLLTDPSIHLINTSQGLVGRQGLVRDVNNPIPTTNPIHRRRLSEMFELRLISIDGGRIVYEDRETANALPVTWQGIQARLNTEPTTNPLYRFDFTADSGAVASMKAKGVFDIDQLLLTVEELALNARAEPGQKESPVPASLQQLLQEYGVAGAIAVTGTTRLPLADPQRLQFDLTARLMDARVAPVQWAGRGVDRASLTLRLSDRPIVLKTDPTDPSGKASEGRASIAITSTVPTTSPATMLHATLENAEFRSGDTVALIPKIAAMVNAVESAWQVHELVARVTIGSDLGALPPPLRELLEPAQLLGMIECTGRAEGSWRPEFTSDERYRAHLLVTSPSLIATDRRLTVTNLRCDLTITPATILLSADVETGRHGLRADAYGGKIAVQGNIVPGKPFRYDLRAAAGDVDVQQVVNAWSRAGDPPVKASGRAFGTGTFAGVGSHDTAQGRITFEEAITGRGEFEVLDGDFYELPAISKIASAVQPGTAAARVGQAAGVFRVSERKIHFDKLAVSAPIMGLQGTGSAGFDGRLDFRVVAAPLADWKQKLQKTRIPIIGDIGAELVGGVQKMLNAATGNLLYQFKIAGVVGNPEVTTEAVPMLTEGVVKLFTQMLNTSKEDRLLEQLKSEP